MRRTTLRAILVLSTVPYYLSAYRLEGDGPLSCLTFEELMILKHHLDYHVWEIYPNVADLINHRLDLLPIDTTPVERDHVRESWNTYVMERLNQGRSYFVDHFIKIPHPRPSVSSNCFGHLMPMWEGMALANRDYLRQKRLEYPEEDNTGFISLIRKQLDFLVSFKRISPQLRDRCIGSIGPYVLRSETTDYSFFDFEAKSKALEEFWVDSRLDFPHWFEFAMICYLHQPSSCAAERVFSLLKMIMNDQRLNCLDDYIQAAVYLQYQAIRNQKADRLNR